MKIINVLKTKVSKIIFFCTVFFATFFTNFAVLADNIPSSIITVDSYTREVEVLNDSLLERDKSFVSAYKDVTGKSSSSIKAKKVATYVRSFSYSHKMNSSGQNVLFLRVEFYPNLIQGVTNKAKPTAEISQKNIAYGESVNQTSDVLTWVDVLGYEDKDSVLLDDASTSEIAANLKNIAKDAGVNISLPLMDLQDVGQVSGDDICSLNLDNIKNASKRYKSRAILVGCIVHTMNGERGQWVFLNGEKTYNWSFYDDNYAAIIKKSLAKVSEILKPGLVGVKTENTENNSVNASSTAEPEKIVMEISGVDSLDKYNEVTSYLKKIPVVLAVDLLKLNASSVKLSVMIKGDKNALISALDIAPQKQLIASIDANFADDSSLKYDFMENAK
jgi:hypothetical protein